jgi:hypothetical protein
VLALTLAFGVAAQAAPETLFACAIGRKRVEISQQGGRLTYRFGRPGRPELLLDAAAGDVRHYYNLYPRGEDRHLRFASGRHGYVVYNIFNAPNHDGNGAVDQAGVLVLDGEKVIARLRCRDGGQFAAGYGYDALPQDGPELDAEKWDHR